MAQFPGDDRKEVKESLKETLRDMRDKLLDIGGSTSNVIEFIFSITRFLCLKCVSTHVELML